MQDKTRLRIAAISGFAAVALGAFGAHSLEPFLVANDVLDTWKTAVLYHLVHTVMLAVPASAGRRPAPALFFAIGILLFSGSLYALCLTGLKIFGPVTPIGGVFFLCGWARLLWTTEPQGPDETT